MSNRLWVLGAVLASIAIIVLGWIVGISPKLAEADAAAVSRLNVEAQNTATEAATGLLKQQFAGITKVKADLKKLQVIIPEDMALEPFFDEIVAAAAANGVVLTNISAQEGAIYGGSVDPNAASSSTAVQPEAGAAATDPNAPAAGLAASLSGRFFTIGVTVKAQGSADQLYALTQTLQEGARLFLVTDVQFTVESGSPGATISGFVYVVRASAPAPVEPAQ